MTCTPHFTLFNRVRAHFAPQPMQTFFCSKKLQQMPREDPFVERRALKLQSPTDRIHTTVWIKKLFWQWAGWFIFEMKLAVMARCTITKAWEKKKEVPVRQLSGTLFKNFRCITTVKPRYNKVGKINQFNLLYRNFVKSKFRAFMLRIVAEGFLHRNAPREHSYKSSMKKEYFQ